MIPEAEDFITVEEAARRLRIGRTRAYAEARRYLDSGGAEGVIPVIAVGRLYRVPVARLEGIAGGPLREFHRSDPGTAPASERSTPPARRSRRRPQSDAPTLFDA